MKKILCFVLALLTLAAAGTTLASAKSAGHHSIARTTYEGNGRVDVDFHGHVRYNNAKVTVKDANGKALSAKIVDRESDELDFVVSGVKGGKSYSFTISGLNPGGSLSGKFSVPSATAVTIKEVDYDAEDRELSVEFGQRVHYNNLKVTLKNSKGTILKAVLIEKDNDEIDLRTSRLTRGNKYSVTVSGVKNQNAKSYTSVTKSFTA